LTKIVLATKNQGKIREFAELLGGIDRRLIGLDEFDSVLEPEETGSTFAENAALKAAYYALHCGTAAIADDSGLVIDALDGRPGVLSARYGGDALSFDERMTMILDELADSADRSRRARFVCSLALADKNGQTLAVADGICEGRIAAYMTGDGGFGYDPIFIPDGFDATFGQLSREDKNNISHRRRAILQIIPFLRDFTAI
jgi:XTP/dITP diphosphohydrolase